MNSRSRRNFELRQAHLPEIEDFLSESGLKWEKIHNFDWHIRVENAIDIFPTRKKYHVLSNDVRGTFEDYDELGRIFMDNLK